MFNQDTVTLFKENFDKKTGTSHWETVRIYGVDFQETEIRNVSDNGVILATVSDVYIPENSKSTVDYEIVKGDKIAMGTYEFEESLALKDKLKFMEKSKARTVAEIQHFSNIGYGMDHTLVTCK